MVEKNIDQRNITPSDFTVFVNNIPFRKSQEETKEFFTEQFVNEGVQVMKVNYCYNIQKISTLMKKEDKVQGELGYL